MESHFELQTGGHGNVTVREYTPVIPSLSLALGSLPAASNRADACRLSVGVGVQ